MYEVQAYNESFELGLKYFQYCPVQHTVTSERLQKSIPAL